MYHSFESTKAGDKVLMTWGRDGLRPVTVEKVTKLHVILPSGAKYRVSSGRLVGATAWDSSYIEPFDQAKWDAYRQKRQDEVTYRALYDFKWSSLDIETVRKIQAMLPAKEETKTNVVNHVDGDPTNNDIPNLRIAQSAKEKV